MSIILRFNGVETEPVYYVQLASIASYYNTYNGGNTNNLMIIPFDLFTPTPSGTVNFSIMDKFEISFPSNFFNGYLYAVRYNLLKFKNGSASLQYI